MESVVFHIESCFPSHILCRAFIQREVKPMSPILKVVFTKYTILPYVTSCYVISPKHQCPMLMLDDVGYINSLLTMKLVRLTPSHYMGLRLEVL